MSGKAAQCKKHGVYFGSCDLCNLDAAMAKGAGNELTYLRPWAPGRDCIARDERGNRKQRAIYIHRWPAGCQQLVFDNEGKARAWAAQNGCEFTGPRRSAP